MLGLSDGRRDLQGQTFISLPAAAGRDKLQSIPIGIREAISPTKNKSE